MSWWNGRYVILALRSRGSGVALVKDMFEPESFVITLRSSVIVSVFQLLRKNSLHILRTKLNVHKPAPCYQ
jgi:hypothetical protein